MKNKTAPRMECDDCSGDSFHISVIGTHNHAQCANPICGKNVCMTGECSKSLPESKPSTPNCPVCKGWSWKDLDGTFVCHHCKHEFEGTSASCSYCGSGLVQDGECQKCGL